MSVWTLTYRPRKAHSVKVHSRVTLGWVTHKGQYHLQRVSASCYILSVAVRVPLYRISVCDPPNEFALTFEVPRVPHRMASLSLYN